MREDTKGAALAKNGDNLKIISLRVSSHDLDKVRKVAQRLKVRESKVLRFAIKAMLLRLEPLPDDTAAGRELMPVFVDFGHELARFFELDFARLNGILNEGVNDPGQRVDVDDIALMAMSDMPSSYRYLKLKQLSGRSVDRLALGDSLRAYLYDKYVDIGAPVQGDNDD